VLEQQIQQFQQQQPPPTAALNSNDTRLDALARIFYTKLSKNETLYERLPIRKIDSMKLDVFMKTFKSFNNTMKIYLLIEDAMPEFFCRGDDCIGYHEYFRKDFELKSKDVVEIKKVIEQVLTILNNLEFCRLHGRLVEKGKQPPDTSLIWKKMIVADNIEWKVNECPVCMEETFSSTICDHPLCRCCFQKLMKSQCPTCRQPLALDEDDSDVEDNS
jgi:hypothetical protein